MAIIAYDTFTDTNGTNLTAHTMNTGTGWVAGRGTWNIQSNRANNSGGGGDSQCVAYTECSNADVTITADVRTGGVGDLRLVCNYVDADNYFLGYAAGTSVIIYEKTAGAFASRASGSISALAGNTVYSVTLQCVGDDVWWTCNGTTIHYNTSSRPKKTATKHGIGNFFGNGVTTDTFQVNSQFVPMPYYYLKHVAGM